MEAIQFDPRTNTIALINKKVPVISLEDHVIVKVAYSGFCGTDLHIIQGEFPCGDEPFTQGHEFCGIVHQVGSQVTHVKVGDKVAVDPQNWCTVCEFCTTGRYHLCIFGGSSMATGTRFDGGFAEYALVRARQVYKLPNSVSLKLGALSEPISCIIRGIERADLQPPGFQSILIIGAGIIGNLWSAVLHHMGHRDVTIVEPQKIRIDMNKKIETGYKCYTPEEFRKAIELDGHSWDLAIDCSGNSRAIEEAVHALRHGGTLVMFGVAPPTATIKLSPFDIYKKELKICGSNINPFCMPRAVKLIEAMGERYLSYERLGIKEFQLREYTKGMEMLASSNIAKLMFAINPALDKTTGK